MREKNYSFIKTNSISMKTILYATDCSKHDIDILQYAHELCNKLKASLILLHVYSIPPIQFSTIRPRKYLSTHAHDEQLNILKEYTTKHIKQNAIKTQIRFEVTENISVSDGILSSIKEVSPDLLLVGMKDDHTAREMFSGSIAKALLEKVNCPLLIVPNMQNFKSIKKIVYATDFEEDDILAIQRLVEIAQPLNAEINIVHIATKDEYAGKDRMEWLKEMLQEKVVYQNITFQMVYQDTVYDGLRSYINSNNADVVALLEREENGFFKRLFHKDLTKKIESNITIPMLSFNQAHL